MCERGLEECGDREGIAAVYLTWPHACECADRARSPRLLEHDHLLERREALAATARSRGQPDEVDAAIDRVTVRGRARPRDDVTTLIPFAVCERRDFAAGDVEYGELHDALDRQ